MKDNKFKINNEELFLIAYDVFLITGIVSISLLASIIVGTLQKVICLFELVMLLLIEVRERKWSKKEAIFAFVCALLFLLCYNNNPVELAIMYVFMFSARNFSFKRIAKHTYKISLAMLLGIIMLAEAGIIKDIVFEGYRYAAGFRYVLYGPSLLLNIVCLNVYFEGFDTKWYKLMVFFLFNLFLLTKCHGNLSFGLTTLLIVYVFCYKFSKIFNKNRHNLPGIFTYSFIFCLLMSFALIYLYDRNQELWYFIDHMLSGRLQLSLRTLSEYSISFFGNSIKWVGNGVDAYGNMYEGQYYYVDNAYVNIAIELGLLFSVTIWGLYTIGLKKCREQDEQIVMSILMIISVYFMFDNLKLKLVYNTFWLALPKLLFNRPLDSNKYLLPNAQEKRDESTI